MTDDGFNSAVLALLMHVRTRVLDGEDPAELRVRLVEEEELDPVLVDQVWISVRPELVKEQEDKANRLRVLGVIWLIAGGVLGGLTFSFPEIASNMVRGLALVAIAAGVFVFQMGSRAAAFGTRISSMDWSISRRD